MSGKLNATSRGFGSTVGVYSTSYNHKNMTSASSIHIGDPFLDTHKRNKVSSRFGGKQMGTTPMKNVSGGVGYFEKKVYTAGDTYNDKSGYLKRFPPDNRKLGFGSKAAPSRDEFTTTTRTEQYRTQLLCETHKVNRTGGGIWDNDIIDEVESKMSGSKSYPAGLTETRHLYDVGRNQNTEFDPKSSVDTFYNALTCKSRKRGEKRFGNGYYSASQEVGAGTYGLDHNKIKPQFGHVKETKTFYDKSHLGYDN